MRKLLLSLLTAFLCVASCVVYAQNWGKVTVYASWELITDFGMGGASRVAYMAIGDANQQWDPYPPGTPDNASNILALEVGDKNYKQVSNHVKIDLNSPASFETDWLLQFSTTTGVPAKVTIRCLSNQLPNPASLKLRLLAVDGSEVEITAVTAGSSQEVEVLSEAAPNTLMATYEVPLVNGVEYALNLAPGWNLVGIPLLEVTDDGGLLHHAVLHLNSVITHVSELRQGAAYWVYNNANAVAIVTLKGTAYIGEKSALANDLTTGWNYVSLAGTVKDSTTKEFAPAESPSNQIWRWDASRQSFVQDSVLELGAGYVIKN
ncbi:MAG: hypothetical protein J5654_08265 [Victivallales bacterium]|nr:hypothetical protein [Victivallales bacterium]